MTTLALVSTNMPTDAAPYDECLSTRLAYALRALNISQSELARKIGIKPQIIQYLCASNAKKSKFSFEIADALGINPEWLIAGQGQMLAMSKIEENFEKIPVIDWLDIERWINSADFSEKKVSTINMPSCDMRTNSKCYALKVLDSSMSPRFEIGTILVVDPYTTAQENDFVIVVTQFSSMPVARQLIKKNDAFFLMPHNLMLYKEIELTNSDKIIGVIRQSFYEFVRR